LNSSPAAATIATAMGDLRIAAGSFAVSSHPPGYVNNNSFFLRLKSGNRPLRRILLGLTC
jgi:hypothetical protein